MINEHFEEDPNSSKLDYNQNVNEVINPPVLKIKIRDLSDSRSEVFIDGTQEHVAFVQYDKNAGTYLFEEMNITKNTKHEILAVISDHVLKIVTNELKGFSPLQS